MTNALSQYIPSNGKQSIIVLSADAHWLSIVIKASDIGPMST